jgi:homoserine kinase
MQSVKIKCPASVGNISCGFDVLGMVLHEPYDLMEMKLLDDPRVIIHHKDAFGLPAEPEKNVAGVVLLAVIKRMNNKVGFEVELEKRIKPGSGLGSSAASAAGAVVAANHLLGKIFTNEELIQLAMIGEQRASGSEHADNIAPCISGGITLIRSGHPPDIVSIPAPDLFVTVIHPQIEIKTADARKILPQQVLLKDAITQWGNVAGLVAGFFKNDAALIGRSLEDVIIEPVRSKLIPGFYELKSKCREAGALGGGISGSGPAIFMLSRNEKTARHVESSMKEVYNKIGIEFNTYVTTINTEGITVVSEK